LEIAMAKPRKPFHIPQLTCKEAHDLIKRIDESTIEFSGVFDELEKAVGMLMIGRLVGWKVLVLIHNKRTIRNYEKILGGINIRDMFPPEGPLAHKSIALEVATKIGNFWKAVSGEVKIEERRELTQT
jgi:hypothetical protein